MIDPLLDPLPDGPITDLMNSLLSPIKDLLGGSLDELIQEAVGDSIDRIASSVSDAIDAGIPGPGDRIKVAIRSAMDPQFARITAKLNELIARVENRLQPVFDQVQRIADIEIADAFTHIGGVEVDVTTIGDQRCHGIRRSSRSGGIDFIPDAVRRAGMRSGLLVQEFNIGLGLFKPALSEQLPSFTVGENFRGCRPGSLTEVRGFLH